MKIHNPYPPDKDAERAVVQTYVGRADWEYLQRVTGQRRGLVANLLAHYIQTLVSNLKQNNAPTYDYEPGTDARLGNIISNSRVRASRFGGFGLDVGGQPEATGDDTTSPAHLSTNTTCSKCARREGSDSEG